MMIMVLLLAWPWMDLQVDMGKFSYLTIYLSPGYRKALK